MGATEMNIGGSGGGGDDGEGGNGATINNGTFANAFASSSELVNGNGKKVSRTRTGCLTCRRRKKKCDEERDVTTGGCIRCKQAGYQCEGFPTLRSVDSRYDSSSGDCTSVSVKRRRSTLQSDKSLSSASPSNVNSSSNNNNNNNNNNNSNSSSDDVQGLAALQAAASSLLDAGSPSRPSVFSTSVPTAGQPLGPPPSFPHTSSAFPYDAVTATQLRMQQHTTPSPRQRSDSANTTVTMPSLAGLQQSSPHLQQSPSLLSNGRPQQPHVCSFIGECILVGRAICEHCLSTIEPLFSPSDSAAPHMMQQPTPSSSAASAFSPSREARHQPVMQSLIGYYSAVVTCWIEGCHPMSIAESPFFRQLVQHLISTIDEDEALRLSVAAVASGYIGGGQLQWPEDLVAIQRWTETLRQETAELVDVTTSSSARPTPRTSNAAIPAEGSDRLARHSYIDRHLSKHAMLLYRMAKRAVDEAVQRASRRSSRMRGGSFRDDDSDFIGLDEMRKHNNLLLSAMNLSIFSWAEMSLDTYYADFDVAIQAAHTLFDGVRRIRVNHLNRLDTIGVAVVVWADTCAAIARGTRPFFELHDGKKQHEQNSGSSSSTSVPPPPFFAFHAFNCPPALFMCLNELARLSFDCKAAPQRGLLSNGGLGAVLPASLAHRASQLEVRLKGLAAETQLSNVDSNGGQQQLRPRTSSTVLAHTGSPNCSEMTRLAGVLLLYTAVYGKGPLHPACKFALQNIVHLWTYGAINFCRAVGCSNYLLPMFMASAVACEARDRMLCDEAMNIVGHNEAVADAARKAVREIWRRTDEDGFPALWTDVVQQNRLQVAFL